MNWIKELNLFLLELFSKSWEYLINDYYGIVTLIVLVIILISIIGIYLSSTITMYKAKRIKYLGLDNAPLSILKLPKKRNLYDKYLIRTYKSKDIEARKYFERQYKIAMEKKELEDSILIANNNRIY